MNEMNDAVFEKILSNIEQIKADRDRYFNALSEIIEYCNKSPFPTCQLVDIINIIKKNIGFEGDE